MFESAIAINEFQSQVLTNISRDLTDDMLYTRSPGHRHPPVWILGHLAITGELGQRLLGGRVTHVKWLRLFGPGSSDEPAQLLNDSTPFSLSVLIPAISAAYADLRKLAANQGMSSVSTSPHGLDMFTNTPIQTVGDMVTLLLTNHYGFHLSQLSSCRRNAGHAPLF